MVLVGGQEDWGRRGERVCVCVYKYKKEAKPCFPTGSFLHPQEIESDSESLFPQHLLTTLHPGDRTSQSQNGMFPLLMAQGGGLGGRQSGRRTWVCNCSLCVVSFLYLQTRRKALSLLLGQVTQALLPPVAPDYLGGILEGAGEVVGLSLPILLWALLEPDIEGFIPRTLPQPCSSLLGGLVAPR